MNTNAFIRGHIYQIKNNKTMKVQNIIFRLININNTHYFAEEISTGCIFPIFNAIGIKAINKGRLLYFSYLKYGMYCVFYPLIGNNNIKFEIDENDRDFGELGFPNIDEVNYYLREKKNDLAFREFLKVNETKNEYMCDLSILKEKIAILKNCDNTLNNANEETKYEEHSTSVCLREISNFGYNLSSQKDLCNLVGREEEIKKIIKTICIREKSVILIGESGSGKTSIVEKIALDIKRKENDWLKGKIIFCLNLSSIQEGTNFRGIFEKNINKIISICKKYQGQIILFIDEIHNLYGLGRTTDASIDAMNILKPYINNGTITIIGATTRIEYEKYMANDPAFLRRFEKIHVTLPDEQMNILILLAYIKELETKYNVKLDLTDYQKNKVVEYIVNITDPKNQKVVGEIKISNPTLSKSIIEDAFVEAIYNKKDLVTIDDICLSIISCDNLSATFRKEKAEKLKVLLNSNKKENNNVVVLSKKI